MRIAVLDDDPLQLDLVERVARSLGHICHCYSTGAACMKEMRRESFDMLIVDWELPDTNGPEMVRWARQHLESSLPILFITHRSEESDIVQGLGSGADDFMTKPLRVAELQARIRALLRRAYPVSEDSIQTFGPYTFNRMAMSVAFEIGDEVQQAVLTHREFALALLLFQNMGRLMSRDYLREAVWGQNAEILSRTLDTHISRLRQLLCLRPGQAYSIAAVYGLGYRLDIQHGQP